VIEVTALDPLLRSAVVC